MTVHLVHALEKLKKMLLALTALSEEQFRHSITALGTHDLGLAKQIIKDDSELDQMEVDIEEECLKILALYQPVAFDLRFVVTALKMTNDLERIGDLSANIAERCISLFEAGFDVNDYPFDLEPMAEEVRKVLKLSIDSLIQSDVELARQVIAADASIDERHRSHFVVLKERIIEQPVKALFYIEFMSMSRYLERIADLCTNIAEDVVYLVEGAIIRHDR